MLRSLLNLRGESLLSSDGAEIGTCKDMLFDDFKWTTRYLDIDTGGWLSEQRVLISPISLKEFDVDSKVIPSYLTKKEIQAAPPLQSDAPVSKQWEASYYSFYGWPYYSSGIQTWGMAAFPSEIYQAQPVNSVNVEKDPNLRSAIEVKGYKISAKDEEFGAVKDFIFDDESWSIRYLVIDTRRWLPGGEEVLISTSWVNSIDWREGHIKVQTTKDKVKAAPIYTEEILLDKKYESMLHKFHGQPTY
jgi:uncharacterized protein YrrD